MLVIGTQAASVAGVVAGVATQDAHPEQARVDCQRPVVGDHSGREIPLLLQQHAAPGLYVGVARSQCLRTPAIVRRPGQVALSTPASDLYPPSCERLPRRWPYTHSRLPISN